MSSDREGEGASAAARPDEARELLGSIRELWTLPVNLPDAAFNAIAAAWAESLAAARLPQTLGDAVKVAREKWYADHGGRDTVQELYHRLEGEVAAARQETRERHQNELKLVTVIEGLRGEIESLRAALGAAHAMLIQAGELLRDFGTHKPGCPWYAGRWSDTEACSCGWAERGHALISSDGFAFVRAVLAASPTPPGSQPVERADAGATGDAPREGTA